jgi:hypothetical protein
MAKYKFINFKIGEKQMDNLTLVIIKIKIYWMEQIEINLNKPKSEWITTLLE